LATTERLLGKNHRCALLDSLAAELLGILQGGDATTVAFCVITRPDALAGWISTSDGSERLEESEVAMLLSAAPPRGACQLGLEIIQGYPEIVGACFEVQAMRVFAGIAHRRDEPPSHAALARLRELPPVGARLGALRVQCFEYERRDLVLRALRSMNDACCVIDLASHRVRWIYDLRKDQPCAQDVFREEAAFVELAERFHHAAAIDEPLPYTAAVGRTIVMRTADLGHPTEFGVAPSLAISLSYFEGEPTKLSSRERQIAQLLANGYSTVNAAAILSLSENTIRTYVRRLYRKLEITNRSDLTRKYNELCL